MQSIEIKKDIELDVDELLQGLSSLDLDSLELFSEALNRIIAHRKSPDLSKRELELIDQIYRVFPSEKQKRYDELIQKLNDESLVHPEHEELLELTDQAETHNVEWLKALSELAVLRGVSLEEVKTDLGINTPPLSK
jgi:hypothetical protein